MAYDITQAEYLDIDGVPLATPAWLTPDLSPLWTTGAVRGDDRRIPGAAGVRPKRRRPDVTPIDLELVVFCERDWEGAVHSDGREGLQANWEHLETNVAAAPVTADGTRTLTMTMPDGSTRTGPVHVLMLDPVDRTPGSITATLRLSLPFPLERVP